MKPIREFLVHWLLFFWICFGLGYPVVVRFDARRVTPDAIDYYKLVTGKVSDAGDLLRYRALVPWVAKPFYYLSRGRIRTWNSDAFGLLAANSLFTASSTCLLLSLGRKYVASRGTALAGTLLYLLDFTMPNRQLGLGMVESGEGFFMMALFWLLDRRSFALLPIVGILGALAKESFVPMCAIALAGWAFQERGSGRWKLRETIWAVAMVLAGLVTIVVFQWSVTGRVIWPWEFAGSLREDSQGLVAGLVDCLTDRYFWYVFAWLLPLGAMRLRRFPPAWIWASMGGVAASLAMGAWNYAGGNAVPSIYNSMGPVLSLSAAVFLSGEPYSVKKAV
jgi:hypothetical protein